jgi:hypothetical protein
MRAIYRYATQRTPSRLTYNLRYSDADGDGLNRTGWGNYHALEQLIEYLKSTWRLHTANRETRKALWEFVETIDRYMREADGSSTLVEIKVYLSGSAINAMEQFGAVDPRDLEVALGARGRYLNNKYLENDVSLIDYDDTMMRDFRGHTGQEFVPNSCLASAVLYACFGETKHPSKGRPIWVAEKDWKGKQGKATSKRIPTYQLMSHICRVPFGEDGSLRLSLNQLMPFLEQYGIPCYVISASGRKILQFEPTKRGKDMPIVRLVFQFNHVRFISCRKENQMVIQQFDSEFHKLPKVEPRMVVDAPKWDCMRPTTTIDDSDDRYHPFPIRKTFDC